MQHSAGARQCRCHLIKASVFINISSRTIMFCRREGEKINNPFTSFCTSHWLICTWLPLLIPQPHSYVEGNAVNSATQCTSPETPCVYFRSVDECQLVVWHNHTEGKESVPGSLANANFLAIIS